MFAVCYLAFFTGISFIWTLVDRKSEIAPVFLRTMMVLTGISIVLVAFSHLLM